MADGSHFVKKIKVAYWSEMVRNATERDFRTSKMAAGKNYVSIWNGQNCDQTWISEIQNGRSIRNAIESEFRTSKMAAGSHFAKNFQKKMKLHIDLKWPEMRSKVNFGHPNWPTSAILSKISKKIKVAYRCEMDRNEIESDFGTSKMAAGSHFVKNFTKIKIVVLIWNGKKCYKVIFGHPKWLPGPFKKKHLQPKVARVIWTMFELSAFPNFMVWICMGSNFSMRGVWGSSPKQI